MNKEDYIKIVNNKISGKSKDLLIKQINNFYDIESKNIEKTKYNVGKSVLLKKGTLLHGTYKNIEGLKLISKNGLISSDFVDGRLSKYPGCVGVWNLKKDYLLKDYINFYSGGTILYNGIYENDINTMNNKTDVVPYNMMNNLTNIVSKTDCHMWTIEQTKEARFMPSLVQNRVQIGIIFASNNEYAKELLNGDILNPDSISDEDVKGFINPDYYEKFIKNRKNKDDFFTDRESAVLFGIPNNLIEGILVGREYEKDNKILHEIKELLPDAYICNLDGIVIVGNDISEG